MDLPKELRYSDEHEWVKQEEGNKVRIGITDFAQSELGDIVFVELPEVGDKLEVNAPFGSVESVKTVSELYAPVSGQIIEVNEALEDSPENVNSAPYDSGWMVLVEISDSSDVEKLMDAEQYEKIVSED